MTTQRVAVEVEVDNGDETLCANDCRFNDTNQYCQLFGEAMEGGIRLGECRDKEVDKCGE